MTISRGLPLSEEDKKVLSVDEQQQVIENEGKWGIASYGESTNSFYTEQLKDKNIDWSTYSRVVFAGGLHGLHFPIAIAFKNGVATDMISLGFSYDAIPETADGEQNEIMLMSENENSGVYSYNDIVENAKKIVYPENGELSGGAGGSFSNTSIGSIYSILGIIGICIIGLLGVIIVLKKKKS